jgi:hypothetical protein
MYPQGIEITKDKFRGYKRSKFLATTRNFSGTIKTIKAWVEINGNMRVAHDKIYKLMSLDERKGLVNNIPMGDKIIIREPVLLALRPHQTNICDYLLKNIFTTDRIESGLGYILMELKAGLGKTYIGLHLFHVFSVKTLIILPANLIDQWVGEIEKFFPSVVIGYQYGSKKTDGQVVLASPDSILGDTITYKNLLKKVITIPTLTWIGKFGFTIIDEVHTLCTSRKTKIFQYKTNRVLAMSATCNHRLDEMDKIMHMYLGKPVNMLTIFPDMQNLVQMSDVSVEVVKIIYNGPDDFTKPLLANGVTSFPLMVNQLVEDPWRNKLILDQAIELYREGHTLFVFLDRVSQIDTMVKEMATAISGDITNDQKVFSVQGKTKKNERKNAKEVGLVSFVTYAAAKQGLSFDRYTAIIFASPRKSGFLQANNRVFRLDGDRKKKRILKYIVDNKTTLKSQYGGFRKAVVEEYPQTVWNKITVNWEDITLLPPREP